jgi:HK97 family phage major capsid protein
MPESNDLPGVIDGLGRAFEEFKAANDERMKKSDALVEERVAKIDAELHRKSEEKAEIERKLQAEQARTDELERRLNRAKFGSATADEGGEALALHNASLKSFAGLYGKPTPPEMDAAGFRDYAKGFKTFLRSGHQWLSDTERKLMSVGSDPDGGYLVTPDVSGRIVTRVFETSPIRPIVSVQTIGTDRLEGMRDIDEAAFGGWVSEMTARPNTGTPTFGKWVIPVHEMYANPYATQTLLDDANINVEAWLAGKVADKFSRVENAAFINGTGPNQPTGLFTYPMSTTDDATRPWGTFQYVGTATSGDFAATGAADVLFDLIGKLKQSYLQGARWLTRREVITKIRKFKGATTGDYLWQPGIQNGQPDSIVGYPVTIAMDIPAIGANSFSLAFGNFAAVYQIVDRQGIRTMRDPFTNKPFVQFYTTRRVGGAAISFEQVKFLKFGT